jgi:hypothetical protein
MSAWRGSAKPSSRSAPASAAELAKRAIAWASAHQGDPDYALRCLAFVEDAYERSNAIELQGTASAAESAALYELRPYDAESPPPSGAYVFYACGGPVEGVRREWGHVGLALGNGRLVHAWDVVRIDDARAIPDLPPAPGWDAPRLIGWATPEDVLRGSTPRDWDAA